jgi:hypothetical protein
MLLNSLAVVTLCKKTVMNKNAIIKTFKTFFTVLGSKFTSKFIKMNKNTENIGPVIRRKSKLVLFLRAFSCDDAIVI